MKKYYSLVAGGDEADIYIFGDIVDPFSKALLGIESDTSGFSLANEVNGLDATVINVHINSYGGDVSEGLAIHNTLKNHKAKVRTICDGFACSAASVVFMAGDERIMNPASLLMIHNAWMSTAGNAAQLRKDADDLDIISAAAAQVYRDKINIDGAKLDALLDSESWISPADAVAMGFATGIAAEDKSTRAAASARKTVFERMLNVQKPPGEPKHDPQPTPETDPEPAPAPDNQPEQKNKLLGFFNALMGGKE